MSNRIRFSSLLILTAAVCRSGQSDLGRNLKLIAEINLAEHLETCPTRSDRAAHPVLQIRFSPDETHIAVGVDRHRTGERYRSHLMVVPVGAAGKFRQFEVPSFSPQYNNLDRTAIVWSPSGQTMTLTGNEQNILKLETGSMCQSSPAAHFFAIGFLDESRVLGQVIHTGARWTQFGLLDLNCNLISTWQREGRFPVKAFSSDRGLLATDEAGSNSTWILDGITHEVQARFGVSWGRLLFADEGRAFCVASGIADREHRPVTCWDVDGGVEIAELGGANGGLPMSIATRGTRLVVSDLKYVKSWISDGFSVNLRRRILWDFRSGEEIASWRPETQAVEASPGEIEYVRSAFDLSPTGNYYAEGSSGVLRVYKVQPAAVRRRDRQ